MKHYDKLPSPKSLYDSGDLTELAYKQMSDYERVFPILLNNIENNEPLLKGIILLK